MKIRIELDMSPDEARRVMGLPDVAALQADMLGEIKKHMKAGLESADASAMLRAWMPLGGKGFEEFQKFLWDSANRAAGAKKDTPKSSR